MLDNWFIPFAFLTGGIWSGLAGFVGMKSATSANARTAQAAQASLNQGLNVAFSSGAVMGFTVVGLGLLDISIWFHILKYIAGFDAAKIAQTMVMFGMGASFMALFARVGGGIFTKAADVGADLVGKVEAGIPEDDPATPPPSPTTWATTWATWPAWARTCTSPTWAVSWPPSPRAPSPDKQLKGVSCPWPWPLGHPVLHHRLLPDPHPRTPPRSLLGTLRRGIWGSPLRRHRRPLTYFSWQLGRLHRYPLPGWWPAPAIGYFTEYYTSDTYKPTQGLADSTETGAATTIIGGISLGMSPPSPPSSSSWARPSSSASTPAGTAAANADFFSWASTASASPRSACCPLPGHHPGHRRLRPRG